MSLHASEMIVPPFIRTERLTLRRWQVDDASALIPILRANVAHLGDWIPAAVSKPAPLDEMQARLLGYAAQFDADEAWRYAMFLDTLLIGEASMFPRSAEARVPYAESDRAEIGYWLREDETGRGYATEAAAALMTLALALPRISCVEIRCDARNVASAAVPRRLGFSLSNPEAQTDSLSIWTIKSDAGVHA